MGAGRTTEPEQPQTSAPVSLQAQLAEAWRTIQVTLIGSSGRVGGSLALLLKQNIYITRLNIYDEAIFSPGIALDLAHIESKTKVRSFYGVDKLDEALAGSNIVVITPSNDRCPLPAEEALLLNINGRQLFKKMLHVAKVCPDSLICICVEPLNCVMPIATETLRTFACYDPRKIFGITTLNVVRANTFAGREINKNPLDVDVPVVGGNAGRTVVPLFSQCKPHFDASAKLYHQLVRRVQCAEEFVEGKGRTDGVGGPKLAQAYAIGRFVYALCCGIVERPGVVECALVRSTIFPDIPYYASPILLGRHGIMRNYGIPKITKQEEDLVRCSLIRLSRELDLGQHYVQKQIELVKMK